MTSFGPEEYRGGNIGRRGGGGMVMGMEDRDEGIGVKFMAGKLGGGI